MLLLSVESINAQQNPAIQTLFSEDFDDQPINWQMIRSNTPVARPQFFHLETIVTKDRSFGAAVDSVGVRTESYLTTPSINVAGFTSVGLSFDHICYIEQFDDATVQYSFDNGTTWTRIPPSSYVGNRFYDWGQGDFKFSKFSSPLWPNNINNFVFQANTSAWVREDFDLTPLITAAQSTSIMLRLALIDDVNSPIGGTGTHRWFVDNFRVLAADCEVIPPTVRLLEPPRNYPARYEGRVYSTGPYDFDAQILDASLVDTAYVVAILLRDLDNSGFPLDTLVVDTFPMIRRPGNNFEGKIPRVMGAYTVQVRDTIAWKVVGVDASDCANLNQDPPSGYSKFQVVNNLPPSCNTQPIFRFPYYEDFNGFEFQTGRPGNIGGRWANLTGDFHDWWVNSGPTKSNLSTGPSDDIPGGGKYLYVESAKPGGTDSYKDSTASIVTPCFDLNSDSLPNGLVRFYLNMNTSSIDDVVTVDVFDPTPRPGFPNGRFIENIIPPITGFKGNNWIPFEFSTFPYSNTVTQFRFNATPGTDNGLGDMALDSFKIIEAPLIDVRMNSVNLGVYNPENVIQTINVNVQNLSVQTVDDIRFYYELTELEGNVVRPAVGPITLTNLNLEPGESRDIDVTGLTYSVPFGLYSVKAWLDYVPDSVYPNDTAFSLSNGIFNFPVDCRKDFFDDRNLWLTFADANPLNNNWELGTPNFERINSAYSEPNSWTVLLNRPYTGQGTTVRLISPFFDFTNKNDVVLSFLNNRSITKTKDGVFIEYSFDRGVTWSLLNQNIADTKIKRWYSSSLSAGGLGGTPVFADTSSCFANTWNGWYETEMLLPDVIEDEPEVLFRFNFFAENDDDGDDGFSMDNFLIYQPEPVDLEPQHLLLPTSECDLRVNERFKTVVKNRGTQDITSFDIEYRVFDVNNQTLEVKTETINRAIVSRDTIHVTSTPTFDMFSFGDYEVDIITKINSDGCIINDTLSKMIENIDGCNFIFEMVVDKNFRQLPCDSTFWRFNYINGDRTYSTGKAYNDPNYPIGFGANIAGDTIKDIQVCIKSGSTVQLDLNDRDTIIRNYSIIAFDGEVDTIIRSGIQGGPDSPIQTFDWVCPPKRSAMPTTIIVDSFKVRLPLPDLYSFDVILLNDGTDSLDNVNINLVIDNNPAIVQKVDFVPPLRYNRTKRVPFQKQFLGPGLHNITIYTDLPNQQADLLPSKDTLRTVVIVMDTVTNEDIVNNIPPGDSVARPFYYGPFCDNFEGSNVDIEWVRLNARTASQMDISWELGMPSQANVNGTTSGMTGLTEDYPNLDESALLSPLIYLQKDSCYEISFMHNYFVADSIHDGGTFRVIRDQDLVNGQFQVGNYLGDTVGGNQSGWFNTLHIFSIPDNNQNAGWRGTSRGWKKATNSISGNNEFVSFMWRFGSDGSKRSEGWAVDDFCIQNIDPLVCFPVGINEAELDKNSIYLGQNIPNPASYSTSIPYYLPKGGEVQFIVGNLLGQIVHSEVSNKPMGEGMLDLDLNNLSKGVYFYSMVFEGQRITKKMIITK